MKTNSIITTVLMLLLNSTILYAQTTVYVAGYEKNEDGNEVAMLWKNGVAQRLSNGSRDAEARSVYVFGSDVYVAGYMNNGAGTSIATLWTNGEAKYLTDGSSHASTDAVYVDANGKVNMAGSNNYQFAIWGANGDRYTQCNPPSHASAMHGSDDKSIYCAGEYSWRATLWKNGSVQKLDVRDIDHDSKAASVYVSGDDVYVAGWGCALCKDYWGEDKTCRVAVLWKNGERQELYTPSSDLDSSGAYAVFVSGNDVYVAGYTNTSHGSRNYTSEDHGVATLWKNGKAQRLSNNDSRARSIYVSGADVYVAGYEKNARGKNVAVLWKNGVAQRLSDGYYDAEARSIFVK